MVRKARIEVKEGLRGGKGSVEFHHILSPEELNGHGRLYALIRVNPHSSIGRHQHVGDTEPYYILKGHGIFEDHDGSKTEVGPGDVCVIDFNQFHSLDNPHDEPLDMMALIYNE
jgi:mannose-6-phosphate isomerase-like protein (cupin superfamily)